MLVNASFTDVSEQHVRSNAHDLVAQHAKHTSELGLDMGMVGGVHNLHGGHQQQLELRLDITSVRVSIFSS